METRQDCVYYCEHTAWSAQRMESRHRTFGANNSAVWPDSEQTCTQHTALVIAYRADVTRVYTTAVTMLGAYLRGLLLVHILCFQHPRSLCTHMNGRVTFQQKREKRVGTMHMSCTPHHRGASSSSSTDPRRRQTPQKKTQFTIEHDGRGT